jgi:hypothetical protein
MASGAKRLGVRNEVPLSNLNVLPAWIRTRRLSSRRLALLARLARLGFVDTCAGARRARSPDRRLADSTLN